MKESYQTIVKKGIGLYRSKGSRFISYAIGVENEEEIKTALELVGKEHPKSRHVVYAYRLGLDGQLYRANDDGEPSGSAGLPMLGQIDSAGLTDVIVICVRYFGGTLLGVSGLISAYKIAAKEAIENAIKAERLKTTTYQIKFSYEYLPMIMNFLKSQELEFVNKTFDADKGQVIFKAAASMAEVWLPELDKRLSIHKAKKKSGDHKLALGTWFINVVHAGN